MTSKKIANSQPAWDVEFYGQYTPVERYRTYGANLKEAAQKALNLYRSQYPHATKIKGSYKKVKQTGQA